MSGKILMESHNIRSPEKYRDKAVVIDEYWKFPIWDSKHNFVGSGQEAAIVGKHRFEGDTQVSPQYILVRPEEFKESWLDRKIKGRKYVLVPSKDVECEVNAHGLIPSKLKFGKEELHKYEEVRI